MEAERSLQVTHWWVNLQDSLKEWEKTQDALIERLGPILSPMKEKNLSQSAPSQGTENLCQFAADLCRVTEEISTVKERVNEVLKRIEI